MSWKGKSTVFVHHSSSFKTSLISAMSGSIFHPNPYFLSHRRMFPSVRIKVKGMDPVKQYYVILDVEPVDSKRYR